MNSFRRWTASLYTKFEDLLGQMEGHETLASQALSDMSTSLIRAHDQLERIERDCKTIKRELHTAKEAARNWKNRALLEANDQRALECLRRSRTAQVCELDMRDRLEKQEQAREHVQMTLRFLEEKFQDLRVKRLRADREQKNSELRDEIASIVGVSRPKYDFARWDVTLSEQDFPGSYTRNTLDGVSQSYFQKEEEEALREELEALRGSPSAYTH